MNLPQGYVPLSLEHCEEYCRYLAATPRPTADLTFTNLWGWAEY